MKSSKKFEISPFIIFLKFFKRIRDKKVLLFSRDDIISFLHKNMAITKFINFAPKILIV